MLRKPQGYLTILSDAPLIERDTLTCGHCSRVVFVKPGSVNTVYLEPQINAPDKEEPGAFCRVCMSAICLPCHEQGVCKPLMKRLELHEAIGRQLLKDQIEAKEAQRLMLEAIL